MAAKRRADFKLAAAPRSTLKPHSNARSEKMALCSQSLGKPIQQNKCKRCGRCMSVCPVYLTTLRESDVARGRLTLIEALNEGRIELTTRIEEILSRCLLCGACARVCASNVNTTSLFLQGRRVASGLTGLQLVPRLAEHLRQGGRLTKTLLRAGSLLQALACKNIPETSGLHYRFPLAFFSERKTLPPLALKPFMDSIKPGDFKSGPQNSKKQARSVALFVGCGTNYLMPNIARALINILNRLNIRVIVPPEQVCCGFPALASGDLEVALSMAKQNVRAFAMQNVDAVLTLCASCGHHLTNINGLLADSGCNVPGAEQLVDKFVDAMTFIAQAPEVASYVPKMKEWSIDKRPTKTAAYHAPCHLRNGTSAIEDQKRLLSGLPSIQLLEPTNPDRCCGHGGDFSLRHFGLSLDILKRRIDDFKPLEPDMIVAGCTGCIIHLTEGLAQKGLAGQIKVLHPIELLSTEFLSSDV